MSVTQSFTLSASGVGDTVTSVFSVASGQGNVISESIPGPSTDLNVACVLAVAKMVSLVLYCATADMTVETNSGSAPAATVNLKAGKAVVWYSDSGLANPFGGTNVTALFITLAGTTAATFEMRAVVDPT